MNRIDFYILKQILVFLFAMTFVALAALMLERMVRLLELTKDSNEVVSYISQMLVNLLPHYLGLALPLGFFISIFFTFRKLYQSSEITPVFAAGVSLYRLSRIVFALAAVLFVFNIFVFSYLQPIGRYSYRTLANFLAHTSVLTAVREGAFIKYEDKTILVEEVSPDKSRLQKVFIFEKAENGDFDVINAQDGWLQETANREFLMLHLDHGTRTSFSRDGDFQGTLDFSQVNWPISRGVGDLFRERGEDERELTLFELAFDALDNPPVGSHYADVKAELHYRLVRILTIFIIPLFAIPLALRGNVREKNYNFAFGMLILIIFQQYIEFGRKMVGDLVVNEMIGLWLPFGILLAAFVYYFFKNASKSWSENFTWHIDQIIQKIPNLVRTISKKQ